MFRYRRKLNFVFNSCSRIFLLHIPIVLSKEEVGRKWTTRPTIKYSHKKH